MQRYVRVEEGRLETAERQRDVFMQAMIQANVEIARLRKLLAARQPGSSDEGAGDE